jgi:Tropinone reductase 1
VHTCARNQEQINERVQGWKSKGFKVTGSVCDLTSKSQREELIKTVSCVFDGKLNILVSTSISYKECRIKSINKLRVKITLSLN